MGWGEKRDSAEARRAQNCKLQRAGGAREAGERGVGKEGARARVAHLPRRRRRDANHREAPRPDLAAARERRQQRRRLERGLGLERDLVAMMVVDD